VAKQRIEKRREKCDGERDQSCMKTETPVGIRERTNPRPRPHKPESLHGIYSKKKQRKEKNSAKNQGQYSKIKIAQLDAFCAEEDSTQQQGASSTTEKLGIRFVSGIALEVVLRLSMFR